MVTEIKLPLHSQCVKYLMFIFNLLFVITGIILLSIGAVIHGVYHNYQHFLDNKFFSVPLLLIVVGSIIFFIAFFGCCGAVRENYCMIVTFSSLLVLVFVLELSAGISGYVLKSHATKVLEGKMLQTMKEYNQTGQGEITVVWDVVQQQFDCCGTNNASDWTRIDSLTSLPPTCCTDSSASNCTLTSETLRKQGCFPSFLGFIKAHAVQLGGVGIGIAFVQALGVWFSIFLARSIRNTYETV